MDLETQMETEIAKKLYREKPVSIGIPARPSVAQQNENNLTHWPFASWCQACLATKAKEDARKRDQRIISFDFGYTYVDDNGVERDPEELKDSEEQFGTTLYAADLRSKAVLAVPVLAKDSINLKLMVESVRFGTQVAGGDPIIYQSDGERSTQQTLRAIQHCRRRFESAA